MKMNMKVVEMVALGGVAFVVAVALIFGGGSGGNTTPAPVVTAPAVATSVAPGPTTTTSSATTPKIKPGLLVGAVIPAQTPAKSLKSGWTLRQIAVAKTPTESGTSPNWVPIAALWDHTPATAWTTLLPKKIRPLAPSRGLLRMQFGTWLKIQKTGPVSVILSLGGGGGRASLTIDGHAGPIIGLQRTCNPFSGCGPAPTVGAAHIGLAKGWHRLTVQIVSKINRPAMMVTVYGRSAGASSPVEFETWQAGKRTEKQATPQ